MDKQRALRAAAGRAGEGRVVLCLRRRVCYGLVEGAPGEAAWRHEREEPKMERAQEPHLWSPQHAQDALLRRTELIISVVLRGGVFVSASLLLFGVVAFYARDFARGGLGGCTHPSPRPRRAVLSGGAQRNTPVVVARG